MFGTSGIRGPVGDIVTSDLALRLGRGLGSTNAETVVVGRDTRATGEFLEDALCAGLRESGVDVIRIGVASTPTIARNVGWLGADAGVSVTASHNPPADNGLKFWGADGRAFGPERRRSLIQGVNACAFSLVPWDEAGSQRTDDRAEERHVEALLDAVDVPNPADLSVVVDVGHGAGGVTVETLTRLGCHVTTLNAQEDGRFPGRESEPTAESCTALRATVAGTDADLGIAHDGDADRMMAVAEDGSFLSGDALLALFAAEAVGSGQRIAVPLNTSLLVDDVVAERGGSVERTRVGDVYIAETATDPDVVFGGEPSGAWIWPDETLCPDGPLAAVKLVELVARRGSLSELTADFGGYTLRREKVETDHKESTMERVKARVTAEFDDVQTMDGVRVALDDGWFLIRASGTQPLIRITAEARTADRADELLSRAGDILSGETLEA
jgi:phosphoglucosamine mutase